MWIDAIKIWPIKSRKKMKKPCAHHAAVMRCVQCGNRTDPLKAGGFCCKRDRVTHAMSAENLGCFVKAIGTVIRRFKRYNLLLAGGAEEMGNMRKGLITIFAKGGIGKLEEFI